MCDDDIIEFSGTNKWLHSRSFRSNVCVLCYERQTGECQAAAESPRGNGLGSGAGPQNGGEHEPARGLGVGLNHSVPDNRDTSDASHPEGAQGGSQTDENSLYTHNKKNNRKLWTKKDYKFELKVHMQPTTGKLEELIKRYNAYEALTHDERMARHERSDPCACSPSTCDHGPRDF